MNIKLLEFKMRKNSHLSHFEDLVLLGSEGLEELNDKLDKFFRQVSGQAKETVISQKVDGAPAVTLLSNVEGYPENCIGLKSLLNSPNNAISSEQLIEEKYGSRPDMASKLIYSLQLSHSIPAGEIWQGDCLFSKNDLRETEINGKKYLTFHPNKIVYAISEDNPTYDKIKNSDFGICLHTIYKNGSQSFDIDLSRLSSVPSNIYVMSPAIDVGSVSDQFDLIYLKKQYEELKSSEQRLQNNPSYEDLCNNEMFMSYWNTFENANLADKGSVTINLGTFYQDLKDYIYDKMKRQYDTKFSSLKTDKGRESATPKYNNDVLMMADILDNNKQLLVDLVTCLNKAATLKMDIWDVLRNIDKGFDLFYLQAGPEDDPTNYTYVPADVEGISLSTLDGQIVKIVDRSTFSRINRDSRYLSGFQHESLTEDVSSLNKICIWPWAEEYLRSLADNEVKAMIFQDLEEISGLDDILSFPLVARAGEGTTPVGSDMYQLTTPINDHEYSILYFRPSDEGIDVISGCIKSGILRRSL